MALRIEITGFIRLALDP